MLLLLRLSYPATAQAHTARLPSNSMIKILLFSRENKVIFLEKSIIALLFFFLPCCSPKTGWVYQEVKTKPITSNSANLRIPVANPFNGLELQFLKGTFGTRAYLSVQAREILPQANDPVAIIVNEQPYSFATTRMEGGQRLLLPEEATQLLISALSKNQKVIIAASGGFYSEIPPTNFGKPYRKLSKVRVCETSQVED